MWIRQKTRVISAFFAALFVSTALFAVMPQPKAQALAPASYVAQELWDKIDKHQQFHWLRGCFYAVNIDSVTPEEMNSWDFFEKGESAWDTDESIQIAGNFYGGTSEATEYCDHGEDVEAAFKAIGETRGPKKVFCSFTGSVFDGDSDDTKCEEGFGASDDRRWDHHGGDEAQGKDFDTKYTPVNFGPEAEYIRYYLSFTQQCVTDISTTEYKAGDADGDQKWMLPIVNFDSRTPQNRLALGPKDTLDDNGYEIKVGLVARIHQSYTPENWYTNGDLFSKDGKHTRYPTGYVISCGDAVEKVREFAPAYQKWLNDNRERLKDVAGVDGTLGTDGGTRTEDTTCEGEGGALSWFLCPVLKMLDSGIEFLTDGVERLLEVDEDKYNNESLVTTWRALRNIALLILVPMMLLMVIGTALEFGPFDAYTVKKALPRMMLAVLFITLSLFITQFFINISNVVGRGIEGLVLSATDSPKSLSDLYSAAGGSLFTLAAGGAIAGVVLTGTIDVAIGLIGSLAFVTFVALLIGYVILVLRELLILVLMLVAPLAILVWIFPDNDKLWKIWKTTFIALLMMFPLIMLLIASGKVFASVISDTEPSVTAFFFKIIAYIAPFFFIPATFKYGLGVFGNLAGVVNDRSRGLFDRQRKKREGLKAMGSERVGRRVVAKRADWQSRLQRQGSGGNWLQKRAFGATAAAVGGYNIQARASARQASVAKELRDQIDTGDDAEIRALTVNTAAIRRMGREAALSQGLMREKDGITEYKTLGGAWVNEGAVRAGQGRWGKDAYAQQAAVSYEMRKAMTSDQVQGVSERYAGLAKEQFGMSDNQAAGAWIGAGFENQNQHLEFKNTNMDFEKDSSGNYKAGVLNVPKFISEVYEKKGSYPLSQMSAHTIEQLGNAYDQGDAATKNKVKEIVDTFVMRGGIQGMAGDGDNQVPIVGPQPAGPIGRGDSRDIVSAPGAASVNKQIKDLHARIQGGGGNGGPVDDPGQPGLF